MKTSTKTLTSLLAGAGILAAALLGAAPASASSPGTTGGGASTICVEGAGAGVAVRVVETPVARAAITQNLTTGADGCVSFASSGVAKTTVSVTALGRTGTATFSPSVGAGLIWADAVAETGKLDAPERTLQHKYVQADRQGVGVLTVTR